MYLRFWEHQERPSTVAAALARLAPIFLILRADGRGSLCLPTGLPVSTCHCPDVRTAPMPWSSSAGRTSIGRRSFQARVHLPMA
jgi:hypothetical protein